jgi:hypothetical protein
MKEKRMKKSWVVEVKNLLPTHSVSSFVRLVETNFQVAVSDLILTDGLEQEVEPKVTRVVVTLGTQTKILLANLEAEILSALQRPLPPPQC